MSPFAPWRWIRTSSLWTTRALVWTVVAAGLLFGVAILSLRYWVLPNADRYRVDITRALSEATRQRVTIGKITGNWDGVRPQLVLDQVVVHDSAGKPALELRKIDGTLSWWSLATLQVRFYALDIAGPALKVRRDRRGVISVAGMTLDQAPQDGGGLMDLLLQQRNIAVRDAHVVWHDEFTGAPPLELKDVNLQILNSWNRHRFGLRAVPPADIAGALDVRGDLTGDTVKALERWNGRIFVQLDYADIAAWRKWIRFPVDFPKGTGAVRAWLTFGDHTLKDLIADVALSGVKTRLAKDLPELDLSALAGRVGWKTLKGGFEVSTTRFSLSTADGLALQPTDFLLRIAADRAGKPARGELRANVLDLAPLVALADRLPLEGEVRKTLVELAPKGSLQDLAVRWTGSWPEPEQYSARGRFENLSLHRFGRIPGFTGVSGNIDGTEKSGNLNVNAGHAVLDMPLVFKSPLGFDTLTAQLSWTRSKEAVEFKLSSVSFANPDLSGSVFGAYRALASGSGDLDLTGNLTRADARHVARYVPVTVAAGSRPWLERAFVAGHSNDVRFRVKGNIGDFPFPDNKGGTFSVTARVTGGILDYADRWPRIENIEGDLAFRGVRLDVFARQGAIHGARLGKVHAEIPDLAGGNQILTVTGEADGATSDFLSFIDKSPVGGMIDHFHEGVEAQGAGRLALKLVLPLQNLDNSKVTGSYLMSNNQVRIDAAFPPVDQANGRIEFTESTVRLPSATGVFLGGPISITGTSQRDSTVRITLLGKIDADNVRRAGGPAWMNSLRGATDWRGSFTLRRKLADLVIESSLQGIASNLPAPFVKTAAESVPLRIERHFTGRNQDTWAFSYGDVVQAQFARRDDGKKAVIERGVVRLGGGAPAEMDRPGVWISGTLRNFDLDDWIRLAGGGGAGLDYAIGGIDVRVGELDVFDRKFHDLVLAAQPQGGVMQIVLSAREVEGLASWRSQGAGRLVARLKKLHFPAADARATVPADVKAKPADKPPEFPALDVTIEQFQLADKPLGKLELTASPADRDWRIEKLRISNPDGVLNVDGLWQSWLAQPRTLVNVRLDVVDVGKMLTRFGHPEGVRRGTAKIEGTLSWAGSPQRLDYPSLTGNFVLDAAKGQFLKMEPGIGKLLGILSLQALPRRITLDFRDIFSDGFAFDDIIGAVKVNRGIATTDNFRINGPSARVVMGGEVDLARETQKIKVRVSPYISDGVSIAGALIGGPIAGVATFLAQKLLKDPLNELAAYEYAVTGTWSDPQIARVDSSAAAEKSP